MQDERAGCGPRVPLTTVSPRAAPNEDAPPPTRQTLARTNQHSHARFILP